MLDNDIAQPALGGGLILIILLIGFTVMQHAFAGGALHQGLFSDLERQALACPDRATRLWTGMCCAIASSPSPMSASRLGWRPTALEVLPATAAGAACRRP